MKRFSFKSTEKAIGVMQAIAELQHKDVSDLIHEYFYQLAKDGIEFVDTSEATDTELLDIFHDAIMQ